MTIVRQAVRGAMGRIDAFLGRSSETLLKSRTAQAGNVTFSIRSDVQRMEEGVRLRMLVYFDDKVTSAFLRQVLDSAKENMESALSPITRSGKLLNSFHYKILARNRQVLIYSDYAAASAIQEGFSTGGSVQNLMEWMEYKEEFKSLDPKEQMNIAYAIKNSIESGRPPGSNSTLGMLSGGERKYDYMTKVLDLLNRDVEILLEEVASEGSR